MASISLTEQLNNARSVYDQTPGEATSPGARGLEEYARNSRCQRLAAITASGLNAFNVAKRIHGTPDQEHASPFAEERGRLFEMMITRDSHERLVDELHRKGLLPTATPKILDLERESADRDENVRRTVDLVVAAANPSTRAGLPELIIHPRLRLLVAGRLHETEPDLLILGRWGYEVMEVKSYAARDGYTDQKKTGAAVRQSTIAIIAMREKIADAGLPLVDPDLLRVHLVFARMGTDFPQIVTVQSGGELDNITGALERLGDQAQAALRISPLLDLADRASVQAIPANLCDSCSHSCSMWHFCRTEAAMSGAPVLLGDNAEDLLRPAGTIERAIALRDGDATPQTAEEEILQGLLQSAHAAFQSVEGPTSDTFKPVQVAPSKRHNGDILDTGLLITDQPQEMI